MDLNILIVLCSFMGITFIAALMWAKSVLTTFLVNQPDEAIEVEPVRGPWNEKAIGFINNHPTH